MQELRTRLCSQMAEPPQLLHVLLRRSCSQMLAPPHSRQKSFSRVCGHFLRTAGIPHSALPLVSLRYQPAITALAFVFDLHTSCARLGRSSCDHRRPTAQSDGGDGDEGAAGRLGRRPKHVSRFLFGSPGRTYAVKLRSNSQPRRWRRARTAGRPAPMQGRWTAKAAAETNLAST